MKKFLTDNLGLKILSILASMVLWTIVVNVDDPIITRTYSGIPVEITNSSVISQDGKTYEVLDGTDTVTVVVQANRSVIESMSSDYIKATADMRDITIMNTVAIEVRSTRYSDRIDSISSRTKNLKVQIEDLKQAELDISLDTVGDPAEGHAIGTMRQSAGSVMVSGPESVISSLAEARVTVDISDLSNDAMYDPVVQLFNYDGEEVDKKNLTLSVDTVHLEADVLKTKEIGVSFVVSGTTAEGYGYTGTVLSKPNTVAVAGEGKAFDELNSIAISDLLSVAGATNDVSITANVADYLPKGVILADKNFDGNVMATAYIEPCTIREMSIPVSDIAINNLPDGYIAMIVSETGMVEVDVQGVGDAIKQVTKEDLKGAIDATTLTSKLLDGGNLTEGNINVGILEGQVNFDLPGGLSLSKPVVVSVNLIPSHDVNFDTGNAEEIAVPENNEVSEVVQEEQPVNEIPVENIIPDVVMPDDSIPAEAIMNVGEYIE